MSKVTFDGPNKLIICNAGVTQLDVKVDLYSDWKEWAVSGINLSYLPAFRVVGGDPLYGAVVLAPSYFLTNGWRIRPDEANHRLTVEGNIFTEEGDSPYVATLGAYNVLTNQVVTSDPKLVTASGGITATVDYNQIAQAVDTQLSSSHGSGDWDSASATVDYERIASGVWNYTISGITAAARLVRLEYQISGIQVSISLSGLTSETNISGIWNELLSTYNIPYSAAYYLKEATGGTSTTNTWQAIGA